jgi:hypothetical protein
VPFSILFAPYAPFGVVQAPLFIWLAVVGLVVGTFIFLMILQSLVRREQHLYQRIARDIRTIKSKHSPALRHGLPQAAYDDLVQCFETTALAPVWDIFAAQLVVRGGTAGTDHFWTSESAETVFNEASMLELRLNRNFYTAIPGMVTGLGLLFTFIAILFALLDVKLGGPTNKQFTGLDKLVSGLSGKFLSSIVALFAATVFLFYEKRCLHNLTQSLRDLVAALNALVPRLTPAHLLDDIRRYMMEEQSTTFKHFSNDLSVLLDDIRRYMEEQSAAFKHFNSDLSTKLKQGVEEGMGPTRDRMVGAIEELNQLLRATEAQKSDALTGSLDGLLQNLEHSLTSALASLSDRFAETLSGSANREFDQVVSTLGGTARLLEGMNAQFQSTQTALTELVSLARNTTVEQMALGKTQVAELTAVLRGLMTQMHQATDISVNHITTTLTVVVHDLSTRVTELVQQMSQTVTANAREATGGARAVIERADQWSTRSAEQLAQLLEKHHSQLDRVQDVQRTLDASLVQFKGMLTEHTTVTSNLFQIARQTSVTVTAVADSTKAIQDASAALEHAAHMAASQVENFKVVVGSMDRYKEIFRQVEDAAGKLLVQIDQHLRNYQETTQDGFNKLTSAADGFITDATNKLGATVNELDEHLEDLSGILERFRDRGGANGS